jgi:hypothetical protein
MDSAYYNYVHMKYQLNHLIGNDYGTKLYTANLQNTSSLDTVWNINKLKSATTLVL